MIFKLLLLQLRPSIMACFEERLDQHFDWNDFPGNMSTRFKFLSVPRLTTKWPHILRRSGGSLGNETRYSWFRAVSVNSRDLRRVRVWKQMANISQEGSFGTSPINFVQRSPLRVWDAEEYFNTACLLHATWIFLIRNASKVFHLFGLGKTVACIKPLCRLFHLKSGNWRKNVHQLGPTSSSLRSKISTVIAKQ